MPKRKVPSGLKRASGMLMSPVGPAVASEDRPHAITPVQHAGKRRIAPCRMQWFHVRNAASAGPGARARRDFALPRLYPKNETPPGLPWQGFGNTRSEELSGSWCFSCRSEEHTSELQSPCNLV